MDDNLLLEEQKIFDLARRSIAPRNNYQQIMEEDGLLYYNELNNTDPYWVEDHYYEISQKISDRLQFATSELFARCKDVVSFILDRPVLLETLGIPRQYWNFIRESWRLNEPNLIARFDFTLDNDLQPKLLELNIDTPVTEYESSLLQHKWFHQQFGHHNENYAQFNYIHPKLVARFDSLKQFYFHNGLPLYISCVRTWREDTVTTNYFKRAAEEAGLPTKFIHMEDIGYDTVRKCFVDKEHYPIFNWYKLYPWEWLLREDFGQFIPPSNMRIVQPAWTILLNNKGILPLLWELFPNHPNLLAAYWTEQNASLLPSYVRKPLLGREGANITIVNRGAPNALQTAGPYGNGDYIFQETCILSVPDHGEWYPGVQYANVPKRYVAIGSWIVGDEPAGFTFREDTLPIIHGDSSFVPHVVKRI